MSIETVLGPVDASALTAVSMHEHVLGDFRTWYTRVPEVDLDRHEVCIENLGFLHWHTVGLEDNLLLDDPDIAVEELRRLQSTPVNAVLDLTNINIGRRVSNLAEISLRAGIHIAVSTGFYIHDSHPDWLESMDVDDVHDLIRDEVLNGIDETDIRPAIIGELGTSAEITARERKVLTACGRVAAETGICVNVHLDPRGRHALDVVGLLADQGMPTDDIVLSHMQNVLDDWGYHLAVADTGAVLEYDTFGEEGYYSEQGFASPRDTDRMDLIEHLVEAGRADQLVLGNDVWLKSRLVRYGGCGYAHLATTILGRLRQRGVSDADLEMMLRITPIRILDRSARRPSGPRFDATFGEQEMRDEKDSPAPL